MSKFGLWPDFLRRTTGALIALIEVIAINTSVIPIMPDVKNTTTRDAPYESREFATNLLHVFPASPSFPSPPTHSRKIMPMTKQQFKRKLLTNAR
mmetsp:Transcript_37272/g.43369  ORF Transcript_37272/g.43369 Transcript_37272/m.43369 type:complete len:95 (+) Transcript_37272:1539-1823(+)